MPQPAVATVGPAGGGRSQGPSRVRRPTRAALLTLAAVAVPLFAGPASAATSTADTAWPQFGQDAAHSGVSPQDTPAPAYRVRWRFVPPTTERGLAAPITDGDVAVGLGPHTVFGVDLATGKLRWQIARNGGSILGAPAIADVDGTRILLFTQGDRAAESALVAFSLKDPKAPSFLWQEPLDDRTVTGVSVDGGTAYTADVAGEVTAVRIANEVLHVDVRHRLRLWDLVVPGVVPTPPAASEGRVVVVARNRTTGASEVDAIEPPAKAGADPTVSWTKTDAAASSASAPTISGDHVIVGFGETTGAGLLMSIGLKDGLTEWSARFASPFLPFTNVPVADGFAFAMGNRLGLEAGLYHVNATTGARVNAWNYGSNGLWSYEFDVSGVFSSPVVIGNDVVVGFDDGRMAAVDATTGVLLWRTDLGDRPIRGLAAGGGAVLATGGSRRGGMFALEHDPATPLLAEVSPSKADWTRMLTNYLIAAVAIGVAAAAIGLLLRSRARRSPGAGDDLPAELPAEGEPA